MSEQTAIALLGVGRWGAHLLRNFLHNPRARVVAVVDPCLEQLEAIAKRFELDVFCTTQWQDVLEMNGLDAVAITTPATTHNSLITAALKQDLHVLAAKPLTLSFAESVQLCRLAEQQQRQLVIDHTYLFHPAVLRGRELVQSGKLGPLRYGYSTRSHLSPVRSDVDAMWDLAIHDIAILNFWLGETPCQVEAKGSTWLQAGLADTVWATLTYPSGFEARLHLSWLNPDKQRRSCLVGENGSLIFDELAQDQLTVQWGKFDEKFRPIAQSREILDLQNQEPLQQVCNHFLDCVQHNRTSAISSGWLGAGLVQTLVALSESMQANGKAIDILKI
ncbi:oxidoreductase domain protein [Leptolyngbya boryana NIES-2135]|jgi:predicted dehydrogenase|uniref:Oxidoreductase domain protein n=1 Tax=Leptolyngbya boryana NIES-2135 TaxID=1973484 RepID=A0A1Z4JEE4_LEPBY|nr:MULTISPECIES: Gfo/Idh/MocA family oxidoreductase [Leptolyngbya]BAY55106.1 oxidoreductase domain protein [Leptolyngbya boryana NIES-2135]MBD2366086.1 Gfo/Idh/MocA family oxidoreductase [Leptolyngbya sp. FACHB-161]MBD2372266.1 Gfo/Idh/MocA family oxidoreductase [Leptolyngbya sp. FACHB-238]MBD2396689.1 Gfo/Idh/MocA family oxidoreductase [Leptolyngbya sp. FACHB-239]MBD2403212.1 Gfo/Idh/MocA family oxidoreductase [Leptolyngbya sp. FACHB-402]